MELQSCGSEWRRVRRHSDDNWLAVNLVTGAIGDGCRGSRQLRPKALAVFDLLTTHPGTVVPKKILFEQLWPGEMVGDAALRNAIVELRRELGDDDRDHPMVVTVTRQGYKFAGECANDTLHRNGVNANRALQRPLGVLAGLLIGFLLNQATQESTQAASAAEDASFPKVDCRIRLGERFDGHHVRQIDLYSSPDLGRGDFTIALWLRTVGGDGVILDQRDMSPKVIGYALALDQGAPIFQMADSDNRWRNFYTRYKRLARPEWHHVAIAVDRDSPGGGMIYINGHPAHPFIPIEYDGSLSVSNNLFVGVENDGISQPFHGEIDDITFYRRALSPDQVRQLYVDQNLPCAR